MNNTNLAKVDDSNWTIIKSHLKKADEILPEATKTYEPMSHIELLETVEEYLPYPIAKEKAILRGNKTFTSMLLVVPLDEYFASSKYQYKPLLAIANGHNKQTGVKIGVGLFQTLCSNGLWVDYDAEIIKCRHSFKNIAMVGETLKERLTPEAIQNKVSKMESLFYTPLTKDEIRLLTISGCRDYKLYSMQKVGKILDEVNNQIHDKNNLFYLNDNSYTAYHLYMAMTEVFKYNNSVETYKKTMESFKIFNHCLQEVTTIETDAIEVV